VMVNAARMEGMWPEEAEAVAGPADALALLTPALGPADVVLVKASRVVALDRLADALLRPLATEGSGGLKERSGSPPGDGR
jgi:UDP-N-acetylmuramoyl-tripeptide--D-alanyl-D-alanine ligase